MVTQLQTENRTSSKRAFTPTPTVLLQRKCACGSYTMAGSECDECSKKKQALQRKATDRSDASEVPPIVHEVLRSSGQPLDPVTRAFFEPRFGHDFSQVRVHTDAKAGKSARTVNALAYTVGRDVVFGSGRFQPRAVEGRRLLAHELTHVLQQRYSTAHTVDRLKLTDAQEKTEQDAQEISKTIELHDNASNTRHSPIQIARQEMVDETLPLGSSSSGSSSRSAFFCSKSVAFRQNHAFFRVGGADAGSPTFELEHDEHGDHCPCGIQGVPERDYPEDKDSTDARCIPAPMISVECLESNWDKYPIGKYCALGPNSNTYAHVLAEKCGGVGVRPPGSVPGFDDPPPPPGTANPALDARLTFLPTFCQTIDCDDDTCKRVYF